jgi:preprotein translocase subunit SecE
MPKVMKEDRKNVGADEEETELAVRSAPPAAGGGFFSVYKKGQGKITRVCTGIAAAGVIGLVANWLYTALTTRALQSGSGHKIALGVACGFFVVTGVWAWRLMNRPRGAEFLITTDSEMKKVNWASRRELFGSTRVVIIFLALIAFFLFFADLYFGELFRFLGVLLTGPLEKYPASFRMTFLAIPPVLIAVLATFLSAASNRRR